MNTEVERWIARIALPNLALAFAVYWFVDWNGVRSDLARIEWVPAPTAAAVPVAEPEANGLARVDLPSAFGIHVVEKTVAAATPPSENTGSAEAVSGMPQQIETGTEDAGQTAYAEPEAAFAPGEATGPGVFPIIRRGKAPGSVEIGNFRPVSLRGGADDCLNFGYEMLSDAGMPNDLLYVMTATEDITIAKICASNGSVIISCRNEQVTISPRPPQPNDDCTASG